MRAPAAAGTGRQIGKRRGGLCCRVRRNARVKLRGSMPTCTTDGTLLSVAQLNTWASSTSDYYNGRNNDGSARVRADHL